MDCDICGKEDPIRTVLLPIVKRSNERDTLNNLTTRACMACARKLETKAYCKKHDRVHGNFADGSTACLVCIEEAVDENKGRAVSIRDHLTGMLPEYERDTLVGEALISSAITGSPEEISILRFVACHAQRKGATIDDVLRQIEHQKSVDLIFDV